MLTLRSAAKVPSVSWPDAGWELDPISSNSLTKLPAPNCTAGSPIVVLGLTLFIWVPLTTRFLNADPAELKDELKPEACAVATPRTTSAVPSRLGNAGIGCGICRRVNRARARRAEHVRLQDTATRRRDRDIQDLVAIAR